MNNKEQERRYQKDPAFRTQVDRFYSALKTTCLSMDELLGALEYAVYRMSIYNNLRQMKNDKH